jgi:CRISPR-associated protein Csd1
MILQSLYQLYEERLKHEEAYKLPQPGYSMQDVSFEIVINPDGSLVHIVEIPRSQKKKLKQMQLPGEGKTSGKVTPNSVHKKAGILWNDLSYMTGIEFEDSISFNPLKFEAFRDNHKKLGKNVDDPHLIAALIFLDSWDEEKAISIADSLKPFTKTGFGVFRIVDNPIQYLHQRLLIQSWFDSKFSNVEAKASSQKQQCLITGEFVSESDIESTHSPKIKGIGGTRTLLVSFEGDAYRSYNKKQSQNAPVSKHAVFAYCNALNALLSGPQSYRHKLNIGDTTVVFWTERKTIIESIFAQFLDGKHLDSTLTQNNNEEDPVIHLQLQSFLESLRKGGNMPTELADIADTKFFILGLSNNTSRLVVRFWHISTIQEMAKRLRAHYDSLVLIRRPNANPYHEPEFPSAYRLLLQTMRDQRETKKNKISPLLGAQLMQTILNETRYPMTLYQGVLNRLRNNDQLNYLKAAIIKAVLIRNFNQTIEMSLNTERIEPAYLLGRLFAALEKTQEDAYRPKKINAGIRERFYSSASATPGTVFPRILRTYQHHLSKLKGGMKVNRERLIQSIHAPLDGYPAYLDLEAQGLFAIGYYHQRQALFPEK